jgi:hypothetical protein
VAALDEAAVCQAEHDLAIQAAGVLEVDILEEGRIAQLGRVQPSLELLLFAGEPLGVDEKAESFIEAQLRLWGRAELLPEGLGHTRELHRVHLVQRLFHQHSCSLVAA